MASASKNLKIDPGLIQKALNLSGVPVDSFTAIMIYNTIKVLEVKGEKFSIRDVGKTFQKSMEEHKTVYVTSRVNELSREYQTISQFYLPKSKHPTQLAMGKRMEAILKSIETLRK